MRSRRVCQEKRHLRLPDWLLLHMVGMFRAEPKVARAHRTTVVLVLVLREVLWRARLLLNVRKPIVAWRANRVVENHPLVRRVLRLQRGAYHKIVVIAPLPLLATWLDR